MDVVYRSPWHSVAFSALIVALLAWWGFRELRLRGFNATVAITWILALTMGAVQFPSYALDAIRVDGERMRWREGPWWAGAEGAIRFADVRSVRVERRELGSGRLRRPGTVWVVESIDGSTDTVVVFELWMEHYQDIRRHFVARGIPVTGDE